MLRHFLTALASLIVLDVIWLSVLMHEFYRRSLAPVARMAGGRLDPRWPIAALVYPVIAIGLSVFVVSKARSSMEAFRLGALFGAVSFSVYDLTNHATLREWRTAMTIVDIGWGALSCGIASWIAASASRV